MFKLRRCTIFRKKNKVILKIDGSNTSQKLGQGNKKHPHTISDSGS